MCVFSRVLRRSIPACLAALGLGISGLAAAQPAPLASVPDSALIESALADAVDHGLGELVPPGASLDERLLAYARAQRSGRIPPRRVDSTWAYAPQPFDAAAGLTAARAMGPGVLAAWLGDLAPPHDAYRALVAERRRYAAMAEAGGWAPIAAGPTLKPGGKDPRAPALRTRLLAEGYAVAPPAPGAETTYDPGLEAAVKAFQMAHGLPAQGVVATATVAALNVSATARVRQIDLNLERWRWLPRTLPADRIEVDVAGAEAVLYEAGQPSLDMRVIVGDPRHETPLFASVVDSVVFNPPWKVPDSIASKELLPKAARNPGYLASNGFSWVDGRLQQRPGPKNSLGQIKFDFDSPFGVYLHDTPAKSLFQRDRRTLSHGCIRLEKPRDLALKLLAPQGWTAESIAAAIAAGTTRRVALSHDTAVLLVYRTAVAGPDGRAVFRPDVYGWDAKLERALGLAPAS